MERPRYVASLALAVAGLAVAGSAQASSGVSIDVGSIAVRERLLAGGEYRLPTFGVRNPGTEPTTYRLTVTYVDGQQANQPPQSWFAFAPSELTLAPANLGRSRRASRSRPTPTSATIPRSSGRRSSGATPGLRSVPRRRRVSRSPWSRPARSRPGSASSGAG